MKIYEDRLTAKRTTVCRICGNAGHLWVSCSVPLEQLKLQKEGKKPDFSVFSQWLATRYKYMTEESFFGKMATQFAAQTDRKQRLADRKARRERLYGKKASKRTCGFCGDSGHNRRNCTIKKEFINDLSVANTAYRKRYYDEIVTKMGLAEGALVAVSARQAHVKGRWVDNFSGIGIISAIQWNKVNIGLACDYWDFRSDVAFQVIIEGETFNTTTFFSNFIAEDLQRHENEKCSELSALYGGRAGGWGFTLDEVLVPSQNPPSEQWFNETYSECWDWITKKKTLSQISHPLTGLIAKFHPSRRGRNAGKLKKRLIQYGYNIR